MSNQDTILGSLKRGFQTLKTKSVGRRADRHRKRIKKTRAAKRLSETTRIAHKSAVRRAKRFNTKKR